MALIRALIAVSAVGVAAGGCDSIRGAQEPLETTAVTVAAANRYPESAAIIAYTAPDDSQRENLGRRAYRDRVVSIRLMAIEARYRAFVYELREARIGAGFGGDVIMIALGALGAFIPSATAKTVFAATSAGVAGARASFDKNLFYDKALPALVEQMNAARDAVILRIMKGLDSDITDYPMHAALRDLKELESYGSIESALIAITATASKEAKEAKADLQEYEITRTDPDKRYIASKAGRDRVEALIRAVAGLSNQSAIALARNPPVKNSKTDAVVKAAFPTYLDSLTAAQAKDVVKMRISFAKGPDELDAWDKAIR